MSSSPSNVMTHHRVTAQRRAVMEVLRAKLDHPTADEVYHRVRRKMPRVSLATVYRNLDVLAEQRQIKVLEHPGQPRRYDVVTDDHYHIRCVDCGCVEDVHIDRMPDLGALVADKVPFDVLATRLEFEGRCRSCREKAEAGE